MTILCIDNSANITTSGILDLSTAPLPQIALDRTAPLYCPRHGPQLHPTRDTRPARHLINGIRAAIVVSGGKDAGTHPLTIVCSSGFGTYSAAKAVNRWLDSDPAAA